MQLSIKLIRHYKYWNKTLLTKHQIMKRLFLFVGLVTLAFFACKKSTDTKDTVTKDPFNATDNVTASTDNSVASVMFDDVYRQVDNSSAIMKDSCSKKKSNLEMLSTCAVITLDSGGFNLTTWPKYLTVDFGTTGCLGSDGRTRKGKIHYKATHWMNDSASVCTVTTDNYYVDGYKIEGLKTITNLGHNSNQHLCYHVVVTNGLITHPNGAHHTWATDRVTEWINGDATVLNPWDDKFSTTGSAHGVTTTNVNYTITIDNAHPLITEWTCRWIEQGMLTTTVGNQPSITVDYGNGVCNDSASFTIYGYTYNFIMP